MCVCARVFVGEIGTRVFSLMGWMHFYLHMYSLPLLETGTSNGREPREKAVHGPKGEKTETCKWLH